jgi:hypothetical protein
MKMKEAKKLVPITKEEAETAEKLAATGVKDVVENADAVSEAEVRKEKVDKENVPSLFVDPERRIRVHLEILYDPVDGKVLMVAAVAKDRQKNELKYLRRINEWIEFSHPNYDDMVGYRENSMSYDKATQQFLTDPVKLRLCFVRYHLVDWSMRDKDGSKIEIEKVDGSLTSATIAKVGTIMPAIMDVALTEFEKETLLGT